MCTEAWSQKTRNGICGTMRKYQAQVELKIANPWREWTINMLNVLERRQFGRTRKEEFNVLKDTPMELKHDYMQNSHTSSLESPEGETRSSVITSVLLPEHFLNESMIWAEIALVTKHTIN